jgi:xylulokinase
MPGYFLAFDVGTSGVKAGIVTQDGHLLATASREYPSIYPAPQWVEQSIDKMWQAQCEVSQELIARSSLNPKEIAAIGISCQRATFVPVDRDEKPLTNFIGWQDKRSVKQCEMMREIIGDEQYYQIAGLPIEPTAAVSKIMWLKDNQPDIFDRTYKFYSTQNVHLHQLGVENAPCDLPDASYIGLLDVKGLGWSRQLLNLLEIPAEKMPAVVPSCCQVGQVSKAAAQATGLPEGIPLVTAGGDLQVGGLGLGVAEPGVVSLAMGTGAGVMFCLNTPLFDSNRAMACLAHCVPGTWEMEGICLASGGAHKWFRDILAVSEKDAAARFGVNAFDILNLEAADVPPGSNGLIIMPCFAGAGSPFWYPKARGVIMGITLGTDKKTLARAMMEGITLELSNIFEAARKAGAEVNEVRVFGGASKSRVWNQISADVYGVPVYTAKVQDTGLIGASICAGIGIGLFADAREGARAMVRLSECYEPNPKTHCRYQEIASIYRDTFNTLKDAGIFERICALD